MGIIKSTNTIKMLYSPEDNIVEVKPNVKKELQFYRLKIQEKTNCKGKINKQEIIKDLHFTITRNENIGFEYHIEVFDRIHRNREFSLSEKDLINQIASITDDIKIVIDENFSFVSIKNFNLIKRKAKQKNQILSKKYLGEKATKLFQNLERFYKDEKLIFNDLQRYDKYGLLLTKFLGYYRFGKTQNYSIRYTNFLKNTFLEVNETVKMTRLNREIEEVELTLNGEINLDKLNKSMFEREMKVQNIPFNGAKDYPKLNKYEGKFIFNSKTGKINNGSVNIIFSFGDNYSKEMQYELVTLALNEV